VKKIIIIALLAVLGWQGYTKYQTKKIAAADILEPSEVSHYTSSFTCDGRTYCSQMTSCEEATFFLRNCPGVKMDGNNDGIPCEKQWCS
jgi:hypothetical protein